MHDTIKLLFRIFTRLNMLGKNDLKSEKLIFLRSFISNMNHKPNNTVVEHWIFHIQNTENGPTIVDQTIVLRPEYRTTEISQNFDTESNPEHYYDFDFYAEPNPEPHYDFDFYAEPNPEPHYDFDFYAEPNPEPYYDFDFYDRSL
jgi:hypothetical protein